MPLIIEDKALPEKTDLSDAKVRDCFLFEEQHYIVTNSDVEAGELNCFCLETCETVPLGLSAQVRFVNIKMEIVT